jgi:ComF family protein
MILNALGRTVLDWILPRSCRSCERVLYGEPNPCFCGDCWRDVALLSGPCCPSCGKPFKSETALLYSPSHRCGDCRQKPPRFDRAVAAGAYEGVLAKAIQLLKYGGNTRLAGPLADLMVPSGSRFEAADALVPVPLHPRRLRERDYNQALLLCDAVGKRMGLEVIPDGLERVRETPPQTGLPLEDRKRNVRKAFAVKRADRITGRRLILVDDVLTTGATANECARMLKRAEAKSVGVLTLARVDFS